MKLTNLKNNALQKYNGLKIYFRKILIQFIDFVTEKYFAGARWFIVAREKMTDLRATNLDLANFHLQNGNLNDAIFRLKLVDKFFTSGDSRAKFLLGWCYLIKQDFKNAQTYFEATKEPEAKDVIYFIKSEDLTQIPSNILIQYYEFWADKIDEELSSSENIILKRFLEIQTPLLDSLKDDAKILELGCKTGVIGEKISAIMNKNYLLEAVEISQRMCRMARNRNYVSRSFYAKVNCQNIEEYLKTVEGKFDYVIAYNSFNTNKNFAPLLKQLKKKMPKAQIILCLKLSQGKDVDFDRSKFNFVYDTKFIEAEIESVGLKISTIENIQDDSSEEYYVVLCS